MRLAIMQPYLFPYLGYFHLLAAVDHFLIYDDVQYMKGGWINRNRLLNKQTNEALLFTFGVEQKGLDTDINEREFSHLFKKEKKKLIGTLRNNYSKAPHYKEVMQLVERILEYPDTNVARFIGNSLKEIARYLALNVTLQYSSEIGDDASKGGKERVLQLCKALEADQYINAIGGRELYDKAEFKEQGIELSFVQPELKAYEQWGSDFIAGLSILDVLMFNHRSYIKDELLQHYALV